MAETLKDNQIAAGHDNEVGFTNVEELTDANGIRFGVVNDFPHYRLGSPVLRGDKQTVSQGSATTFWSNPITKAGWYYIYNTLLSGALSGNVTIRTQTTQEGTYSNFNAILTILDIADYNAVGGYLDNFEWRFTDLSAT